MLSSNRATRLLNREQRSGGKIGKQTILWRHFDNNILNNSSIIQAVTLRFGSVMDPVGETELVGITTATSIKLINSLK